MGNIREAPRAFVRELQQRFGSEYTVRWNTLVSRWEFVTPSAVGRPVSQFWGWYYTVEKDGTKRTLEADPVTGLHPFRDLDRRAQLEVLDALERTYIGNRHDGPGTWKEQYRRANAHNAAVTRTGIRQAAETYADVLNEVDMRRPWLRNPRWERQQARKRRGY